jgi:hypothetical protein
MPNSAIIRVFAAIIRSIANVGIVVAIIIAVLATITTITVGGGRTTQGLDSGVYTDTPTTISDMDTETPTSTISGVDTVTPTTTISTTIMILQIITDAHLRLVSAALGGRNHGVAAVMPGTNRSIPGPANT